MTTAIHISVDAEQHHLDYGAGVVADGALSGIGLLRNGTTAGKASVVLTVQLADGTTVVGQTTWAAFRTAVNALAASPTVAEEVIDP